MNRLTGNDFPEGVIYYEHQPVIVTPLRGVAYYVAVPQSEATGPTRGIVDTLTGYVTQATSSVTNLVPRPPYTVNVPDVFSGLVNRLTNGYNYVQNVWQSRPAFLRPPSARPVQPVESLAEIIKTDELIQAANPPQIAIFAPQAPIARPKFNY
jgi:hypothetical protein